MIGNRFDRPLWGALLSALFVAFMSGSPARGAAPGTEGTPQDEVVIAPTEGQPATSVHVGQTFAVARPESHDEWQVVYNPGALLALTAAEKIRQPGLEGWRFKAIQSGETQILLTSVSPPCAKDTPCAAPIREQFVIRLQVAE
jgi:hypothetical protein